MGLYAVQLGEHLHGSRNTHANWRRASTALYIMASRCESLRRNPGELDQFFCHHDLLSVRLHHLPPLPA